MSTLSLRNIDLDWAIKNRINPEEDYRRRRENQGLCWRPPILKPNHSFVRVWQIIIVWSILLTSLFEMFMVSFDSTSLFLWVLVYICDLLYILDIALTFYVAYDDGSGKLIFSPKKIRWNYLKTTFTFDLLSTVPTDVLAVIIPGASIWKTLTEVRLNRLLRLYKVLLFFDSRESELGSNTALIRGLKYGVISVVTTHGLTCAWFSTACEGTHKGLDGHCQNDTWTTLNLGFPITEDVAHAYIVSLYWATATATSTGYGDIHSVNLWEKWFSIASMLMGIAVYFGMLLGGLTSMLTNFDHDRARYVHRLNTIKAFLKDSNVAADLQSQVLAYYEYLWVRKKGVLTDGIYNALPLTFQAEISHNTNKGILEKAPVFKDLGEGFLRMLSLTIKPVMYLPKQIIITRGDVGHHMYFIHRGEVEVLSEEDDDTPVATLKSGKLFGEVSLLSSMPRTATVRAATHCDLMVLEKTSLHTMLIHYPEISEKLHKLNNQRMEKAENILIQETKSDHNPHFEATQPRKISYVGTTSYRNRRQSFAPDNSLPPVIGTNKHVQRPILMINEQVDLIQTDFDEMEEMETFVVSKREQTCDRFLLVFKKLRERISNTTIARGGLFNRMWRILVACVVTVVCFLYPYMACFTAYDPRAGYFETSLGQIVLTISYFFDLIILLDVFVELRTEVETDNGTLYKFKDILRHSSKRLCFYSNIFAILPLEALCILAPASMGWRKVFAFLRLNRLLKFLKVSLFFAKLEEGLDMALIKIRTIKFVVYIALLSHWVACVFYISACYGRECVDGSWIRLWLAARREKTGHDIMMNTTAPTSEYVVSLYWAAATMSSTGYGDIYAHSLLVRVFSLSFMLVGLLLYGYCLALMAATLANLDAPRVGFQEKLFAVMNFMKERHQSQELKDRVVNYLNMCWQKHRGCWMPGQKPLMFDMPAALQQDLAMEDICHTLSKVPLFLETDEAFLRALCLKVCPYMFNPGDVIVYAGDMGREMYFIKQGYCQIKTPDLKKILAELGPGQYFGDIGMLFGDYRTATVQAKTHSEVLELTNKDLEEILNDFPLVKCQFFEAQKRKEYLRELQAITKARFEASLLAKETQQAEEPTKSKTETNLYTFRKRSSSQEVNEDYEDPIKKGGIFARIVSYLLMRRTFLPKGRFLRVWTFLMIVSGMIWSITIPLQVAFFHTYWTLWFFHCPLDILTWANLFIGMHTAYYANNNVIVTHPLSTSKNYLKSNFLIDLISCFPTETIMYCVYPYLDDHSLHLFAVVRLNRILNVYRLPLAFNYLESAVHRETGTIRGFKYFFYIVIMMNWMTCALFMTACPPFIEKKEPNTLTGHFCEESAWICNSNHNISFAGISTLYSISFYWAAATSVSVGYGDIVANTDLEMVIALVFMIVGVLFFGYIIASVAASLANADAQRARFQEKLTSLRRFMEDQNLERSLQDRVLAYYDYVWLRTKGIEPDSLFNGLPLSLWGDVTLSLYQDVISKISLFANTETSFIKMLSKCIKPLLFLKGEYIVKKHDIGSEMFFIHRGAVDVTSEDGAIIFDVMRAGQSFGEVALLFSVPRTASIRAKVNSDVFVLTKQDLDVVLDYYPAIKQQVMNIAEERRQQALKRSITKVSKESKEEASKESVSSSDSKQSNKRKASITPSMPSICESEDEEEITSGEQQEEVPSTKSREDQVKKPSNKFTEDKKEMPARTFLGDTEEQSGLLLQSASSASAESESSGRRRTEDIQLVDISLSISDDNLAVEDIENDNNKRNISQNNNTNGDAGDAGAEVPKSCIRRTYESLIQCNRFTIKQNSKNTRRYLNTMAVMRCLSGWIILYQAAFQDHHPAVLAVTYSCDFFFLIEGYIRSHLSFYDTYGDLVDDFDIASKHYLKKPSGFSLDLAAAIPLDFIALAAPAGMKLCYLSYLRLIHLLHLIRVQQVFNKWEKELNVNMLVVRLCKFLVALSLMMHFFSCVWFAIGCPNAICSSGSWAESVGVDSSDKIDSYCSCLYWCVATMTSTGYGDISASSILEMLFASIVMIIGKLMFGFVLGNIASTLANAEANRVHYDQHVSAVKSHMKDQNVPKRLQDRVLDYYYYIWSRNKGEDMRNLFRDAPTCLKAELALSLSRKMLESIPLFVEADESFLRQVAQRVNQVLFLPGDFIVRKGDIGTEVFYVHRGEVEIVSEDDFCDVKEVLVEGCIFGEVSLVYSLPRQVTARAKTHVDLFTLTNTDVEDVLSHYPTISAQVQDIAQDRFGHIINQMMQAGAIHHTRRMTMAPPKM